MDTKTEQTTSPQPPPFVVGDVVTLNSGGQRMSVAAIEGAAAQTVWFDGKGDMKVSQFPIACLRIAGGR